MPAKKKVPSERELFIGCKSLVLRVSFYLLVAVILVFNLFPFFCALLGSFRPSNALFSTNLSPKALNFDHYNEIFVRPIFVESLINSAILAGSTVLISLAFGSLCAYALARLPFRFKGSLLYLVLVDEQCSRDLPAPGLVRDVEKPGPLQYTSRACSYLSGFHDSVYDLGNDSTFPQRIEGP